MLFAACEIVEVEVEPVIGQGSGVITVGATFEDSLTKSDVANGGGFTWSSDDKIWIYSQGDTETSGYWNVLERNPYDDDHSNIAHFSGTIQGWWMTKAAVFPVVQRSPYTNEPGLVFKDEYLSNATLSINLPSEIQWADATTNNYLNFGPMQNIDYQTMQADNVMVAFFSNSGSNNIGQLNFYNVGGLFRLMLNNVPAGAKSIEFFTVDNKRISGRFQVHETGSNPIIPSIETEVITTTEQAEANENKVTIVLNEALQAASNMVLFIPVPVGSYQIGFDVKNASGTSLWTYTSNKENSVARAQMKKMPVLTCNVDAGGSGEGTESNTVVTNANISEPSAVTSVNLPNTTNDVFVRMNQNVGTINIAYSTEANAEHPDNVYLTALGDISTLTINLPDSHVELSGDGNAMETIGKINANTAVNTLKVFGNLKIGNAGQNDGLTVTGGSLELNAPVAGKVTVAIPAANVNSSEEKVNVEINSAITNLVITSAATQEDPDKVWVSINKGASVAETITVPEVNCNLYIANGASATAVTTSAEVTTIAGAVEELTASGEGTTVVVEKAGSVSDSITSTDNASVYIEERTNEEVQAGTAGEIADIENQSENGGTIETIAEVVAMIGSTPYTSLAAAFEAAQNGDTVTLVDDCSFSGDPLVNTKNITLDLGSHNIVGDVDAYMIQNQGTLIINASSTNPGKVYNTHMVAKGNGAILNDYVGTITINGGIFGDNDDDPTNTGTVNSGCALRNRGVATVNGGVFTTSEPSGDYSTYYAYAIVNGESDTPATITINGGDIYGKHGDLCCNTGTMVVNDVTTHGTAEYYNLYAWKNCTITVNGGTFVKNKHNRANVHTTFCAHEATSNIIVKGGSFTQSTGSNFKQSNSGVVSLQGGTYNKQPEAVIIAAGYAATQTGSVWTVAPAGVAAIGSTAYATLAEAFEAAQNGDTVSLLSDSEVSAALVNDKNITLDLGSYSIYGTVEAYLLQNQGTLIINADSSNPGKIYNLSTAAKGHGAVLNDTEGTITINGGIFGDNDADPTNAGVVNSGCGFRNRGNATVNGGVFTTAEPDYNNLKTWAYAIVSGESDVSANITINGGHIYGKHGDLCNNHGTMVINDVTTYGTANYYSIYAWKEGTTTVNGGTFVKSGHSSGANYQFYADESTANIIVKDGSFTKNTTGNFAAGGGNVSLQGGTYNKQPEAAIIAAGYAATQSGSVWTVAPASAAIGSTYYANLDEAFAAATGGQTITLLADLDFSQAPYADYKWSGSIVNPLAITVDNVTLDLNNHTISNMGNCALGIGSIYAVNGTVSGVTIKNGTLNAGTTDNVVNSYVLLLGGAKNATIQNVTTNGGINACAESDVLIKDCVVNGTKYYTVCAQTGANVTISGTTYTKNTDQTVQTKAMFWVQNASTDSDMITSSNPTGAFAASVIALQSGNFTLDSNGSFYLGGGLAPVISGGTYNFNPSAYCASGCAVIQSSGYWTVYSTLASAVAAATDGQTVTIPQAGEYTIPAITKNLTIEASVSGVVVNHTDNSAIVTIDSGKTATFNNITFNLGDLQMATAHGFGTSASSGALVMNGCTVNGALHLYGASTFTNCTFAVSGQTKYNIWAVNSDATFTGCSFTNTDRAVNVYDNLHGSTVKTVSFSNCSFTCTATKKAAINIHHNPDHQAAGAKYAVSINNCTTVGPWADSTDDTGEADTTTCYNALWMVSDFENWSDDDITVSVNDEAQTVYGGGGQGATGFEPGPGFPMP